MVLDGGKRIRPSSWRARKVPFQKTGENLWRRSAFFRNVSSFSCRSGSERSSCCRGRQSIRAARREGWQKRRPAARKKLLIDFPSSFGEMNGEWQGTALVPACKKCPAQQQDKDIPKAEHGYDAPASIGIILIGWLYGEGGFRKIRLSGRKLRRGQRLYGGFARLSARHHRGGERHSRKMEKDLFGTDRDLDAPHGRSAPCS